jgi:small multidrug resistance family-3 protein
LSFLPMELFRTFQPSHFHRIYAAYGGIFIVMALLWGWDFQGIKPNTFEIIGASISVVGVMIIYYMPRKMKCYGVNVID